MADSEEDANGDEVRSSSSSDFGPVENMVVIPIPAPSVIHTLIPVDVPEAFIPPSLPLSPSPLYVKAWECQGLRPFASFPLVVRALSGPPFLSDFKCMRSDLYSQPRLPRSPRPSRSSPFYLLV